ncbi:MAG: carbohydrate kinase family protein [Candidatus Woesearchaeota archaeon]
MALKYDVITFGSGTRDVFANTDATYIMDGSGNYKELISYPTGSKILINQLKFEIGGGGTNTAYAFSRLGLKTAWLGKIGNDSTANHIMDFIKKTKIDFIGVKGKGTSGYSVILDSKGHDRTILTHKGENDTLSFDEIKLSKLSTRWIYFSSMMGKSFQTQKKLASYAGKNKIKLAFNPSSYQAKFGYTKLGSILKNTDVLTLNLEESRLLLNKEYENNIESLIIALRKLGPRIVVITDGNKGAYCLSGNDLYIIYPHHDIKIIETTGAGDAFASSFVAGLMIKGEEKADIEYALRLGVANSESVIQNYGAKNRLLTIREAEKAMKQPTKIIQKEIRY